MEGIGKGKVGKGREGYLQEETEVQSGLKLRSRGTEKPVVTVTHVCVTTGVNTGRCRGERIQQLFLIFYPCFSPTRLCIPLIVPR